MGRAIFAYSNALCKTIDLDLFFASPMLALEVRLYHVVSTCCEYIL
jgi:hypothetical protein